MIRRSLLIFIAGLFWLSYSADGAQELPFCARPFVIRPAFEALPPIAWAEQQFKPIVARLKKAYSAHELEALSLKELDLIGRYHPAWKVRRRAMHYAATHLFKKIRYPQFESDQQLRTRPLLRHLQGFGPTSGIWQRAAIELQLQTSDGRLGEAILAGRPDWQSWIKSKWQGKLTEKPLPPRAEVISGLIYLSHPSELLRRDLERNYFGDVSLHPWQLEPFAVPEFFADLNFHMPLQDWRLWLARLVSVRNLKSYLHRVPQFKDLAANDNLAGYLSQDNSQVYDILMQHLREVAHYHPDLEIRRLAIASAKILMIRFTGSEVGVAF